MRTGFWIAAGVMVVFSMFRGWREGLPRLLARLVSLVLAYVCGWLAGKPLVPALRQALDLPDFLLAVLGGVAIGLTVYAVCSLLIAILLRRTDDQESTVVRLLFGLGGSLLGLATGLILVWFAMLALRLAGTIADARIEAARQVQTQLAREEPSGADGAPNSARTTLPEELAPPKLILSISRLKSSVDNGITAAALDKVDVIPDKVYSTLGRVAQVLGNPAAAGKFMEFPGAEKLARHPKIASLAGRPEIAEALRKQAYIGLLRHPEVVAAANDPELNADLRAFDLDAALDYALGGKSSTSAKP